MASQCYHTNLPSRNNLPELTKIPGFLTTDFPDFSKAENYGVDDPLLASSFNEGLDVFRSVTESDSLVYYPSFSDRLEIPAIQTMGSGCCISSNSPGHFLPEPLLPDSTHNFRMATGCCSFGEETWQPVTEFRESNAGLDSDRRRFGRTGDHQAIHSDLLASIEESRLRVCRYSMEEKKERIRRYLQKRNQRNFNKTIKYACRKTLADSRPRVRGRFARNDELNETASMTRNGGQPQEEDVVKIRQENEDWLQRAMAAFVYISAG